MAGLLADRRPYFPISCGWKNAVSASIAFARLYADLQRLALKLTGDCSGGADAPSNMQWQTIEVSNLKDKTE